MRTLFIIPLVLMSLLSFPSWGLTMDDLVERDGIYYKKFGDVPFTGEVKGVHSGITAGKLKNGRREGNWIDYWKHGQLWYKGNFTNGREEGSWISYWGNGQLMYRGDFKNGRKEGSWNSYMEDGTIWKNRTGTYHNGMKVSD